MNFNMDDVIDCIRSVQEMRDAQKKYFTYRRNKTPSDVKKLLDKSLSLEREVDKKTTEILLYGCYKNAQGSLF